MNFSSYAMSSTICMTSSIIVLSEELRAAHRGASYHAATPKAMPLKVDVHSTDLVQLMRKRFVQTAALITAHNPASKKQTPAKNKKANVALQARIDALSLGWLPGHRKAFKEGDPIEEGFLVFGITGGQLEALMVEFDQEVTLWCPSSGTPVLMLHPLARRNYSAADIAWEKLMKEAGRSAFVRPTLAKEEPSTITAASARKQKAQITGNSRAKKEPVLEVPAASPITPVSEPVIARTVKTRVSKPVVVPAPPVTPPLEGEAKPARKPRTKQQDPAPLKESVTTSQVTQAAAASSEVAGSPSEKPVRKTRTAKTDKAVEIVPAPVAVEPASEAPAKPVKPPRKPKAEAASPTVPEKLPATQLAVVVQAPAPVVKTPRKKSGKV